MKRMLFVPIVLLIATLACEQVGTVTPTLPVATETQTVTATFDPTASPVMPTDTPSQTVTPTASVPDTATPLPINTPTPIVNPTPAIGVYVVGISGLYQRICTEGDLNDPVANCPYLRLPNERPDYAPRYGAYEVYAQFEDGSGNEWLCVYENCAKVLAHCYNNVSYGDYRSGVSLSQFLLGAQGELQSCN